MTIQQPKHSVSLPSVSYLPINRCNLPARILGSLTFQRFPVALLIDGVMDLHADFFAELNKIGHQAERAIAFTRYMQTFFSLATAIKTEETESYARIRADYLCLLRGWMFDSNRREGAVIKGWVESRFGLLPRWHKSKIDTPQDEAYAVYMHERTTGVYNTNAIEAQLDLLYAFSQYELQKTQPETTHLTLYRGTDFLNHYDIIDNRNKKQPVLLVNNINSFSSSRERADEFGANVFEIKVPREKIFYFNNLIAGTLQGEKEYIAIGGLYQVTML